ncbi:MAG: hypothetical protein ABJZ55_00915 [Fuerstiella sp.]
MPYEAQRFIHAANVRLDVPVSVHLSEQLTDELQHALEDATLTTFDFVVQTCIDRKVDYLLLSGNVFPETDRSLRARLTLLNGFRRLNKQHIPVFVIPGDADPAEAWRAIPEMPENVTICYSSNPEPETLIRNKRMITAVSASMWYGATDAFGIRVVGRGDDGLDPFRIGIVSRAKYDESRRMAAMSAASDEDFLNVGSEDNDAASETEAGNALQNSEFHVRPMKDDETTAEYEAGFRDYIGHLMTEARLNYVAYMGELDRLTITLEDGKVHCPGTTQPRSELEATAGQCSMVTIDEAGKISFEEVLTSAVVWKNIDLRVEADSTLNGLLQQMKKLLDAQRRSLSDRIWAVQWTMRGPLPVLHDFLEEDLELAVAVELEDMKSDGRPIRLCHQIRTLPDPWEVPEKDSLAMQYADSITEDAIVSRRKLMNHVRKQSDFTEGWRQRFESLVAGVDRERILSRMRIDGAQWFVPDIHTLTPDFDDFDEDILQDEEVDAYGLTSDEDELADEETSAAETQYEDEESDGEQWLSEEQDNEGDLKD